MPGDFDFDDEPAPKKRRRGDDDDDRDEEEPRRSYRASARSSARLRISFGGLICAGGGAGALVSMLLPAGFGGLSVFQVVGGCAWIWIVAALVIGLMGSRVREVAKPTAGDIFVTVLNVLGGLGVAALIGLIVVALNARVGLKGLGTIGLALAALMVAGGTLARLIEQILRWGDKSGAAKSDEDDEEERPRRKRRQRDAEEEDEDEPRPKTKSAKPKPRDEDDEDEPRPSAKKRRSRGEDDEDEEPRPKLKPKAKPKPPEDLPDE